MYKQVKLILTLVVLLTASAIVTAGCGGGAAGDEGAAAANSAYSDVSIAELIDVTVNRKYKAVEYTRLIHHDVRIAGETGTPPSGADPAGWQVSIVVPGDQSSGAVLLDLADSAFAPLADSLKAGSPVTVEGEFTGANKDQNPTIFVHNIMVDGTTYQRPN